VLRYSRILVTGGAGFIGSHIVEYLLRQGFEVVVLDNFSSGRLENIADALNNKNCHLIEGDIRDLAVVKRAMSGVDAVFHEAALISIPHSIENPILTSEVNIIGTLNLLKTAADSGVKRFVFASSAAVYGEALTAEKVESAETSPSSPYGVSKLACEKYLKVFFETNGLETISLRYFNVYGSRQNSDVSSQYGGVIPIFLNRLLNNLSPVIYGDGEQTRDFVFVQDVVQANMCALNSNNAKGDVFNVGSGTRTSINQVANLLKLVLNKPDIPNIHEEPRVGDVKHCYANISKAASMLNWTPKCSFEEGISALTGWYSSNHSISNLDHNLALIEG
jgi:UDP-glucose 4-epimerase